MHMIARIMNTVKIMKINMGNRRALGLSRGMRLEDIYQKNRSSQREWNYSAQKSRTNCPTRPPRCRLCARFESDERRRCRILVSASGLGLGEFSVGSRS